MKKLVATLTAIVVVLTIVLFTNFKLATASTPIPQAQFFHTHISQQLAPCIGKTILATFPFSTNQAGAFDITLSKIHWDTLLNNGDSITVSTELDGKQEGDALTKGAVPFDSYDSDRGTLSYTTTGAIAAAGAHNLSLVFTANLTYCAQNEPGVYLSQSDVSLAVVTPATSN